MIFGLFRQIASRGSGDDPRSTPELSPVLADTGCIVQ